MIKQLTIQNFQSHKYSELQFSDGVNVIVGSTDSGKTAIIRALKWLVWNRPGGDSFRSHWSKEKGNTFVEIQTDKHNITRLKSKSNNEYSLNGVVFNAFGTEVPKEIQEALNINEINLQQQLDSPFLLSKSAGEVAHHFNTIAHLDKIDSGIKNIQTQIRTLSINIDTSTDRVNKLTTDIAEFDFIDKFEIELEVIEATQKSLTNKIISKNKLSALLKSRQEIKNEKNKLKEVLSLDVPLSALSELIKRNEERKKRRETLASILSKYEEVRKQIEEQEALTEAEQSIQNILNRYSKLASKKESKKELNILVLTITNIKNSIRATKRIMKEREEELQNKMPIICPFCGSNTEHHNY